MMAWIIRGKKIYDKYKTDEMTVYAAQVSFFVMLSFVPFIMLLLTAVQMIPAISQAEVLELVVELTPADYKSLAFRIVKSVLEISSHHDLCYGSDGAVVRRTRDVQHGAGAGSGLGKGR